MNGPAPPSRGPRRPRSAVERTRPPARPSSGPNHLDSAFRCASAGKPDVSPPVSPLHRRRCILPTTRFPVAARPTSAVGPYRDSAVRIRTGTPSPRIGGIRGSCHSRLSDGESLPPLGVERNCPIVATAADGRSTVTVAALASVSRDERPITPEDDALSRSNTIESGRETATSPERIAGSLPAKHLRKWRAEAPGGIGARLP